MKQARLVDDILRQIDLGQFKQAEQKCAALQIEFPQQVNIAGLLAYLRLKAGRSNAARKTLNQALDMNPDDTRVLRLMARAASDDENHGQYFLCSLPNASSCSCVSKNFCDECSNDATAVCCCSPEECQVLVRSIFFYCCQLVLF